MAQLGTEPNNIESKQDHSNWKKILKKFEQTQHI